MAAVFALVGVPLLASALGTLAASPPMDQQTFAMMQVIAGLLCILIAVVAGVTRPAAPAPVPAEAPCPAAPQPPAAAPAPGARDKAGLGLLVIGLAVILIALATWLHKPGHERNTRAVVPVPPSGSTPGSAKPAASATPAGGTDAMRSAARPHAPPRARSVRTDDD